MLNLPFYLLSDEKISRKLSIIMQEWCFFFNFLGWKCDKRNSFGREEFVRIRVFESKLIRDSSFIVFSKFYDEIEMVSRKKSIRISDEMLLFREVSEFLLTKRNYLEKVCKSIKAEELLIEFNRIQFGKLGSLLWVMQKGRRYVFLRKL